MKRRLGKIRGYFSRTQWLMLLTAIFGSLALVLPAWLGSKVAIVVLGLFGIAQVFLNQFGSKILHNFIDDATKLITEEREFNRALLEDYMTALQSLNEHDPDLTVVYLADFRLKLMERFPELEQEFLEYLDKAARED